MDNQLHIASRASLACRMQVELPLVSLAAASVRQGKVRYQIDQRLGPIDFAVDQSGLFSAHGQLSRFTGGLALDRADPLDVQFDVALDLTSIELSGRQQRSWPPFAPWFDVMAHPAIRFRSSAVAPTGRGHYAVRGLLEIGGVTRLQTAAAEPTGRAADPITQTEVVELLITSSLACSAFGMPPGLALISGQVELRIGARIELEA